MKKNASKIVIIILTIIVVILAGYIIRDKYILPENSSVNNNDLKNDAEKKNDSVEEDNSSTNKENANKDIKFENYDISNIQNIVITTSVEENGNPVEKTHTVTEREEIIEILNVLDKAKYVNNIPEGIGFIYPTSIEVNHKADPSISIIFMSNGNVAINYVVGVAENNYAEYSLNNKNFEKEITQKYFS